MCEWISVALPKGRLGEKAAGLLETIGYGCGALAKGSRALIFENPKNRVRCFWAKPSDVAIYVERGAADVGIVDPATGEPGVQLAMQAEHEGNWYRVMRLER